MPTSHFKQINEIIELVFLAKPHRILDIGIGYGKYGFLSREYLEIWGKEDNYNPHEIIIDGLEAYEKYITETHRITYNNIYIGNALEVLPAIKESYDLILLIDVIEHFSFEEGEQLIRECLKKSDNLIISTPRDIYEQGNVFENPYEEHKFQWERKHFRAYGECLFINNKYSIICFIGKDVPVIKEGISKGKHEDLIFSLKQPIKKVLRKTHLLEFSKNLLGKNGS